MNWQHPEISRVIRLALDEDIGSGDLTTEACVDPDVEGVGLFAARELLVLAGVELLPEIYDAAGGGGRVELLKTSGEEARAGEPVARVLGRLRTLLTVERVALNFLQRLSGVATLAKRYTQAVAGTHCRVLDTRKTSPGMRRLEKLAVAAGGAENHRLGVFDAILIKNNHITVAGGVREAIERVSGAAHASGRTVEVEVRTVPEIDEALACGASRLLLDNFSIEMASRAVTHIAGRAVVELSGGVTLETVRAYADTGADFVSSGALTHSARAADLNFRIV